MHLSQMLPQMVLAIEAMFSSSSTPAARAIEFLSRLRGKMNPLVTVEIVLTLCLVLAVSVETVEYAGFGAGGGGGVTVFVGALHGGVDRGGVVDVYFGQGNGRDGLAVVIFVGGGGIGVV